MNHQVVFARYYEIYAFQIPEGIDINDTSKVKFWRIKYNTLSIKFVDGTKLKIQPSHQQETDYKYPELTEVMDCDE